MRASVSEDMRLFDLAVLPVNLVGDDDFDVALFLH
jgi:hypothetical protein